MIVVKCGCSKVLKKIDDKKQSLVFFAGECEHCQKNNGDYTKSPYWKWPDDPEESEPKKKGKKSGKKHKKRR